MKKNKSLVKQNEKSITAQLKEMGVVQLEDTDTHKHRMDIRSETTDKIYRVSQRMLKNGSVQWECSCPGWIFKRNCKHLEAMSPVLEALASQEPVKALSSSKKKMIEHTPNKVAKKVTKSAGGVGAITPEPKDIQRMEDIITKSNGDENKMLALCQQMAKAIKGVEKAQRRAIAAKQMLPDSIAEEAYNIFWQD